MRLAPIKNKRSNYFPIFWSAFANTRSVWFPISSYEGHDSGCLQPFLVPTIYHIVYTYPQIHPEKGPSLAIHSRSLTLGWTKSYDFIKHYYNQLYLHRRFLWRTKTNCSNSISGLFYQFYFYDHYHARNHTDPQSTYHFQTWNSYRSTRSKSNSIVSTKLSFLLLCKIYSWLFPPSQSAMLLFNTWTFDRD